MHSQPKCAPAVPSFRSTIARQIIAVAGSAMSMRGKTGRKAIFMELRDVAVEILAELPKNEFLDHPDISYGCWIAKGSIK